MLQLTFSLSFPIFSLMLSCLPIVSATNSNIYVQCSQICYTSTTPYESNVNSLFTSLVDSASISNFNKFDISQTDIVYGLFQCRGDLNSSNCRDCVASSVDQLKTTCPMSVGGTIKLEGCFVKYDNTTFFGVENTVEVLKRCGPSIGYNSDILNRRDDTLAYLIAGNGQYFHEGEFGSIQGVAQCVQDLGLSNCHDCLSEASRKLRSECETSSWGDMYLGTCYVRYDDRDNGNSSSRNSDNNSGDGTNNAMKIIGYIIAAVLGGGLTYAISISVKNSCNKKEFNQTIEKIELIIQQQTEKAEVASKRAEEASKKAEAASKTLQDSVIKSQENKTRETTRSAEEFRPYMNMPYMNMPYYNSYG